jgi:HEAT repeat protein
MRALGRLKDERAAEPLARLLERVPDRHEAIEALTAMGPVAEKAVCQRLRHPGAFVRGDACAILIIGTRQSLPQLEEVVAAGDFFSKRNAEKAIQAIRARR